MSIIKIGIVSMDYDESGKLFKAEFQPANFKIDVDDNGRLMQSMFKVQSNSDINIIRLKSDIVLSSWFANINEIELSDRFEKEMKSEVVDCVKQENGMVKHCSILYFLQDRDVPNIEERHDPPNLRYRDDLGIDGG